MNTKSRSRAILELKITCRDSVIVAVIQLEFMHIEQPNPYSSPTPTPVVHRKASRSRMVVLAFVLCALLSIAMLVAQQLARAHFAGIDVPVETQVVMNPIFVCLPLLCLPFVLASQSWKSHWYRMSLCAFSILFALLCVACFSLAIYMPIIAIRIRGL